MTKRLEKDVKGAIVAYLKLRGHFPIIFRNVGIKKKMVSIFHLLCSVWLTLWVALKKVDFLR